MRKKKSLTLQQLIKKLSLEGFKTISLSENAALLFYVCFLTETIHSNDNIFQPTEENRQRIIPSYVYLTTDKKFFSFLKEQEEPSFYLNLRYFGSTNLIDTEIKDIILMLTN